MFLTVHCVHKKIWNQPTTAIQKLAFHDILQQIMSSGHAKITPVEGAEVTLYIELNNSPHVFEYLFKLKPVDPGPVVQISMTKVNQSIPGLGFHYVVLLEDSTTMFEQRLARAPYPQEISLEPMLSLILRKIYGFVFIESHFTSGRSSPCAIFLSDSFGNAQSSFRRTRRWSRTHCWGNSRDHSSLAHPKFQMHSGAEYKSYRRRDQLLNCLGHSRALLENLAEIFSAASELCFPSDASNCEGFNRGAGENLYYPCRTRRLGR
ncbi:hypothetical protein B0H12DRAFT_783411 [Mycena haematopus]|nr:hypothetical protein B0H12DRAFT_783411 [Mycena haematopus]